MYWLLHLKTLKSIRDLSSLPTVVFGPMYLLSLFTFSGPCIVKYSYNKSQQDAPFLKFIWQRTLSVLERFTVHHQESKYCIENNRYLSYWLCWLSASEVSSILTSLADSQHNQYDKYLLFSIQYLDSWWWTVTLSETCRVLCQINLRNSASCWLLL